MKKSKLLLVLSTAAMMSLASCSGSEGPMGPAGPQGAKGDKGLDGVSITSVIKTGTSGLEDTYTITFSDGNSTTFKIVNGEDGNDGDDGHSPAITINQEGYWCVDGTSLGQRRQRR
ncbi:MAG: collagen-like protein [Firmicutes bacterium]|nr:collagen-like protein [Candidatus Fiminaster equi]